MCARLPNDQNKINYNRRKDPTYHKGLKIKTKQETKQEGIKKKARKNAKTKLFVS